MFAKNFSKEACVVSIGLMDLAGMIALSYGNNLPGVVDILISFALVIRLYKIKDDNDDNYFIK